MNKYLIENITGLDASTVKAIKDFQNLYKPLEKIVPFLKDNQMKWLEDMIEPVKELNVGNSIYSIPNKYQKIINLIDSLQCKYLSQFEEITSSNTLKNLITQSAIFNIINHLDNIDFIEEDSAINSNKEVEAIKDLKNSLNIQSDNTQELADNDITLDEPEEIKKISDEINNAIKNGKKATIPKWIIPIAKNIIAWLLGAGLAMTINNNSISQTAQTVGEQVINKDNINMENSPIITGNENSPIFTNNKDTTIHYYANDCSKDNKSSKKEKK